MIIENNNAYLMAMGEGSRIEIHGADREKETWTRLTQEAKRGTNTLKVEDSTGWEVGDKIAITSTSKNWEAHEEFTITAISADGKSITVDKEFEYNHRGETLEYDNGESGGAAQEWDVEVRAEVALLSRNITIQGDEDSVDDGFGAHTMIMDGASQHIEGAEFFRVGQIDTLARYPIHWHMLGDAEGQYVQNVSVHHSYQKGMTVHGTMNVRIEDSVIFDHIGHGVFLEDGSESGNQILGNLVFGTRESRTGDPIPTDKSHPSSYWIENPSNILIGNVAAGSDGEGFWIFENDDVHGLSAAVFPGQKGELEELIFRDNVAHSISSEGLKIGGQVDLQTLEAQFGQGQFTQYADFAHIDGFTAYSVGGQAIWVHAVDVVISDAELVENGLGVRALGGNHIVDSLIADSDIGSQVYTAGANQYVRVHFDGNEYDLENFASDVMTLPTAFQDVTYDGEFTFLHTDSNRADLVNNQHVHIDIDGSVTGIVGAFVVLGDRNTGHMKTSPDAVYDADRGLWISETTVGATKLYGTGLRPNAQSRNPSLIIERSDGVREDGYKVVRPERLDDVETDRFEIATATGTERDIAYLIDFDEIPRDFALDLHNVRVGESAVYEIANLESFETISGAKQVSTFNALLKSDESAYFQRGSSLFVRLVAEPTPVDRDRPVIDLLADYRAQDIVEITGIESGGDNDAHGQRSLNRALLNSIADMPARDIDPSPFVRQAQAELPNLDFELDRYGSTSDTVDVDGSMERWSSAQAWSGDVPGRGDIVVIRAGDTVVLDQSATVKGVIVDGGRLIIEDAPDQARNAIELVADYVLVINGGLFQAGTEDDPLDRDFTLTLTGDNPGFDLNVGEILMGGDSNAVFSNAPNFDPDAGGGGGGGGGSATEGGNGDDSLTGSSIDDHLSGLDGADTLIGRGGDDKLDAGRGDDIARGGAGADTLKGGDGADQLFGGDGGDHLKGGRGGDVLNGEAGGDVLNGASGYDTLDGGRGWDKLDGGIGNDTMTGGAGDDLFIFSTGKDVITDFEDGADLIQMLQSDFDASIIKQRDADVVVRVGDHKLTVLDFDVADLNSSDFDLI